MKGFGAWSDYRRAILGASRSNPLRVPAALSSVGYARARFDIGPRYHSLFDLRSRPLGTWSEYLVERGMKRRLREVNGDQRAFTGDKLRFTVHCLDHGLPTIAILGLLDTRPDPNSARFPRVVDAPSLSACLANAPQRLFVKLIDGTLGIDAFALAREHRGWRFEGRVGDAAELHAFLRERLGGRRGWLIQPLIEPHASLKRIMAPGALGTARVTSFHSPAGVEVAFPILRIPAGDNVADNFAHGLSGNLVAPIDLASGALGVARYSRSRTWPDIHSVERHPDTREPISGFVLPHWPQACELVRRAHASMPWIGTLGWDIAITDSGPIIVEANSTYDVDLLQVAYGRGLGPDFETFLRRQAQARDRRPMPVADTELAREP